MQAKRLNRLHLRPLEVKAQLLSPMANPVLDGPSSVAFWAIVQPQDRAHLLRRLPQNFLRLQYKSLHLHRLLANFLVALRARLRLLTPVTQLIKAF